MRKESHKTPRGTHVFIFEDNYSSESVGNSCRSLYDMVDMSWNIKYNQGNMSLVNPKGTKAKWSFLYVAFCCANYQDKIPQITWAICLENLFLQ